METTNKFEVKIDRSTLPEDLQWVVHETHTEENLVSQFIDGDDLFKRIDGKIDLSFEVHRWKPLDILWDQCELIDDEEKTYEMKGIDDYHNEFSGVGKYIGTSDEDLELQQISDIECVHRNGSYSIERSIIDRLNNKIEILTNEIKRLKKNL